MFFPIIFQENLILIYAIFIALSLVCVLGYQGETKTETCLFRIMNGFNSSQKSVQWFTYPYQGNQAQTVDKGIILMDTEARKNYFAEAH